MRICFDQVSTTEGGTTKAAIMSLRIKLQEHSRSKDLIRQLEGMLTLLRLSDTESISQTDYLVGLARLEKRAMFTFVSKIYQAEERRHRVLDQTQGDRLVRDEVLQEAVKTAVADPDLTMDQAKALMRQMADNLNALETRLIDYEDTSQTFSPEELPQAQANEENIWARFNAAVPKFMDVVMDSSAPLKDQAFLEMSNTVDKRLIQQLQDELNETRKYKIRFDAMVDELAAANSEEQKSMTPNTVNCINKNLVVANNIKKKTIAQLKHKLNHSQNENKIYKEFADGKISKADMTTLIDQSQNEMNEFQMIKLRKIKVERAKQIEEDNQVGVVHEHRRMSQVLQIFQRPTIHQKNFVIDTKVEVTDWGNIEAIKAGIKDPKQMAAYMEKLRREREGLPPLEEGEEQKAEGEGVKAEAASNFDEQYAALKERPKAKATLFAMGRQSLEVINDYDSEDEMEREII